jgi:hypothetical protein
MQGARTAGLAELSGEGLEGGMKRLRAEGEQRSFVIFRQAHQPQRGFQSTGHRLVHKDRKLTVHNSLCSVHRQLPELDRLDYNKQELECRRRL